jgi:hypothetical protein
VSRLVFVVFLQVFFKNGGTAFELLCCRTSDCDYFCGQRALKYLKLPICNKHRGLLSKMVLLLHNNMCPHSVAANIEAIKRLKFGLLPHLPYRPHLALWDYHMFEPLKEALHGRRFADDDEVKDAVHTLLWSQQITFFADGIRKLVNCYTMCVKKRGDYVKKWHILRLPQIVVYEVINKFILLYDCVSYIPIN